MADAAQKPYQCLPGTGYKRLVPAWAIVLLFFVVGIFALLLRGRRVQLWLGGDHLLSVEWDGTREYYKRFRYTDIQAVTMRRTKESLAWSIVLGWVTAIFAAIALSSELPGMKIFFWIVTAMFVAALIYNLAAGPTCECHLRTAVQTEPMPSLNRIRRAEKALGLLRARIAAVQGEVTHEEIPARMVQLYGGSAEASQAVFPPSEPDPYASPFS
jgi:hypothetical protein